MALYEQPKKNIYGSIGRCIKENRLKSKMTQQQLAKKVGISQPSLANYESGKTIPKIKTAHIIARELGIHVMTLLDARWVTNKDIMSSNL